MDKDILLYCISKLVHQLNSGQKITPWVELSAHEVMVATNWNTGKRDYERFEDALIRLKGTQIITDIPTGNEIETVPMGLIADWRTHRKNEKGEESPFGRLTRVNIKVSEWTFRAINSMEVLSISSEYFRLRRPLERRIYELARKHVGEQEKPFVIGIATLQKKVGSNSPPKKFRFFLKQIISDGHIPDYKVQLDGDRVVFTHDTSPARTSRQLGLDLGGSLGIAPATFEKAKKAAPGYDVYALYEEWRDFAAKKEAPRSADAAFIGFCKARAKRTPLR